MKRLSGPAWLIPTFDQVAPLSGRRRIVADEMSAYAAKLEAKRIRNRRWRLSPTGKAYYARNAERLRLKQRERMRQNKTLYDQIHKRWRRVNRDHLNNYQRMYYAANEKRRQYLREKTRQYRAAKKAQEATA